MTQMRLPQAADEAEELFLHPDGDPRHRPQNGQGADGPVQERDRRYDDRGWNRKISE